jgi:hypothetical protein
MRKLMILGAAACLVGTIGSAQASPLASASANANIEQAMPNEGVTKAWYRGRHYGWHRGHHYGWRHHYWRRHAYWRG